MKFGEIPPSAELEYCTRPLVFTSGSSVRAGEWKLPFASPTGRVDFFGFVIIFEEKKRNN